VSDPGGCCWTVDPDTGQLVDMLGNPAPTETADTTPGRAAQPGDDR
jgi:hypothetical protein